MTQLVRRIVSGNKSRFKDDELDLELDLVYLTDNIIIMGYPATGMEGLYRNRREDAARFLQHRHGKDYWVFNFCPIRENSYDPVAFQGRVSRYPFPDHHAPPLAMMPLFARELDIWLQGSENRVAILHCKAGKGRSGTMACAYLLAHDRNPTPPILRRSYSTKEWVQRRTQETINSLPPDDDYASVAPHSRGSYRTESTFSDAEGLLDIEKGCPPTNISPAFTANPEKSFTDALKGVLDLHTARRMKPPSEESSSRSGRQGVSIPSQRRFLYYWALLLANAAPKHFWAAERTDDSSGSLPGPLRRTTGPRPKVRLTQIRLKMRGSSNLTMGVAKAVNMFIEKTRVKGKLKDKVWASSSQIWASLARYDDDMIDLLEEWEVYTRDLSGDMAKRRPGSEVMCRNGSLEEGEVLNEVFTEGKWDKEKMVHSFGRLGGVEKITDDEEGKVHVYILTNAHREDEKLYSRVDDDDKSESTASTAAAKLTSTPEQEGVMLDADKEIRVKFYIGQVPMGWSWFIPTFHMPQPPPPSESTSSPSFPLKATFSLPRHEIDFAIGVGSAIVGAEIEMEWVVPN